MYTFGYGAVQKNRVSSPSEDVPSRSKRDLEESQVFAICIALDYQDLGPCRLGDH